MNFNRRDDRHHFRHVNNHPAKTVLDGLPILAEHVNDDVIAHLELDWLVGSGVADG
jgi:hypothetical protein